MTTKQLWFCLIWLSGLAQAIKFNDPLNALLKSIYRETYDGFEVEVEPYISLRFRSDSWLKEKLRVEAQKSNHDPKHARPVNANSDYNSIEIKYGNGEYRIFDSSDTVMNRLAIGWGVINGVHQLNLNHTGRIENFPKALMAEVAAKVTEKAKERNTNLDVQPLQVPSMSVGLNPEMFQVLAEAEPDFPKFSKYDTHVQVHLNIQKRTVGLKGSSRFYDQAGKQVLTTATGLRLGLSNIRYSQKGIEVILRSDLNATKSGPFPDKKVFFIHNQLPEHKSTLFLTVRLGHTCMGDDFILEPGCRSMTKLHGHWNRSPVKPVAVTTHKRLLGQIFELYVDVAKKPTQFHKVMLEDKFLKVYGWYSEMPVRVWSESRAKPHKEK